MLTFLKIVLAVILVIVVLVVGAIWYFKRKFLRFLGTQQEAMKLLDGISIPDARIQLNAGSDIDELATTEFKSIWAGLRQCGFESAADFEDYNGCALRTGVLPERNIVVALSIDADESVGKTLFAVTEDRRVIAVSESLGPTIELPRLSWQVCGNTDIDLMMEQFNQRIDDAVLLNPTPALIRNVWEQCHAKRADIDLQDRPDRSLIKVNADRLGVAASEEEIDQALELLQSQWATEVETAILDNYRRRSRVDAVRWERLEHNLKVVHRHLDADDIDTMLGIDTASEELVSQFAEQGLTGLELFSAVNDRLPAGQRHEVIETVNRPILATLFGPGVSDDDPLDFGDDSGACAAAKPTAIDPPAASPARQLKYVYEGIDQSGADRKGTIRASGSGDARRQLEKMGLDSVRITGEFDPASQQYNDVTDEEYAAGASLVLNKSITSVIIKGILNNWLVWLPPLVLVGWTALEGQPFGWGDYVGFVYLAAAIAFLIYLQLPGLLFDRYQTASAYGDDRKAGRTLRWLARWPSAFNSGIDAFRAKELAKTHGTQAAMDFWDDKRGKHTKTEHITGMVMIYGHVADIKQMLHWQRRALELSGDTETARLDLAMSLARYGDQTAVEEARQLIETLQPGDLTAFIVPAYEFTRGVVAVRSDRVEQSLNHFVQAKSLLEELGQNAVFLTLEAEILGWTAVAHKLAGNFEQSLEYWVRASPILEAQPSCRGLVERFNA